MANFNYSMCQFGGRLTKDPELKMTQGGKSVCSFSVAVSRQREGVDYFDCTAWDKTAEMIVQYFTRGSSIFIIATPRQEQWKTQNGETRSKVVFNVDAFKFVDSKAEREANNPAPASASPYNFEPISPDEQLPF